MSVIASQLVAQITIEGAAKAEDQLLNIGKASDRTGMMLKSMAAVGDSATTRLQLAYARVSEAAKKMELAESQAVLAMKKAQDAAHDDSLSLEQVQVAMAKADLAAQRVTTAQANVASAMERVGQVAREESTAVTRLAESSERAGLSLRESMGAGLSKVSEAGQGFIGRIMGMGSGLLDFGSKLGMTIFGLQMMGQMAEQVGGALLEPNASIEQLQIAFTGLLGSGTKATAMLHDLWNFAARTPFEFPDLTKDTQMLLGMGFAAKDVIPVLTAVGDAAAGVGLGADGVNRVTLALGQMQARGKVTGQDMLQLTEAGVPAWRILADSMHLSVAQVQQLSETGKLGADSVTALWQGMEHLYGGQMKNQAQSFNGLLSTFKDNITAAWRAFTGPLFEQAKGALVDLGNLVSSKGFQDFATNVGQKVGGALKFIGEGIGAVVKAIKSPEFAGLAKTLGDIFTPLINMISGPFKSALDGLSGTKMSDVTDGLRQAAQAAKIFLEALEGFQDGSSQFAQAGTRVRDTAIGIGNAALQTWNVMQQVGAFLRDAFTPAWQQLQVTIQSQIIPSWNDLKNSIGPLLPTLAHLGEAFLVLGGLLVQLFGKVLAYVIQIFGGIVQFVSGAFQAMAGSVAFFVDLFTGNFSQLGPDLQAQWNGIIDIFRGALNILNGITGGALDALLHMFGTSMDKINGQAENMKRGVSKSSSDMSKNVQGSFSDMSSNSLNSVQILSSRALSILSNLDASGERYMQNLDQNSIAYWNDVANYINTHPINGSINIGVHGGPNVAGKGFAEGTDYAPGGWSVVGERGPEMMYVPRGAQITPNNQIGSASSPLSAGNTTLENHVHVHIGAEDVTQLLGAHVVNHIRRKTGTRV